MTTSSDLLVAWSRRLRANWPALLLPLLAADSIGLTSATGPLQGVLIVAALVIVVRAPALGAKVVPFVLFAFGCDGIALTRQWAQGSLFGYDGTRFYGLVAVNPPAAEFRYLLPEAMAFLVAGVALLARERSRIPGGAAVRVAFGQLLGIGGQPRTVPPLLLLPVVFLWEEFVSQRFWVNHAGGFVLAVLILGCGATLVWLWPRAAAIVAVFGLLAFGFLGVFNEYHALTSAYDAPVSAYTAAFYGAVAVDTGPARLAAGVEGAVLLGLGCLLVPRVLAGSADADLIRRAQALTQRVTRLTQTRSDATETAVAELRRIERDLHDGAQARLVAVGMSLRAAERLIAENPHAALALIAEARETSSRALTDLRDLVRGIYPPVLADRGLADAVRALALDAPLDADVEVHLPGEPPMPVAAAVYFAIAEALTNTARHAEAGTARIEIGYAAGMLRATVTDDGHGGAAPSRGTGLSGVERRLATFDGILAVSSPPGGPTMIAIEVPCAVTPAAPRPMS